MILASPVLQPPSRRHSASSSGPAARWMHPSTPPPPSRDSLAALTMASTGIFVMSLRTMIRGIVSPTSYDLESGQCAVARDFFCFGHFFPIPKISTPAKVIVAAIHSARAATAKLEIMDGFAFDDISTFFASDCVSDNSRHTYLLRKALLLYFIVSRSFGKHCIFIRRCCSNPTRFILAVSEQILKIALPSLFRRKCYELHSKIIPYVGFRELFYWLWHSGR